MATRLIKVKWNDRCKRCGGTIQKDSEARYDDAARKIYHNDKRCYPPDEPDTLFPDPKADGLADELGFGKPKKD